MFHKSNPLATALQSSCEEAERKCREQQCEDAIRLLEEALRIRNDYVQWYFQLGFCYSGGCRRHSLTNPDMAIENLRNALSLAETSRAPLLRAKILETLGNVLVESCKGSQLDRLHEALGCHREAAQIFQSKNLSEDWAREEFNQANTLCDLPAAECPDKWAQAIEHYENALRVRTRAQEPQLFAATQMNLGTAFRRLPSGARADNVLKSVQCYRRALRVYTLQESPARYANVCNNLGNACLSYPARDNRNLKRHARQAIRHFEQALEVWNSEDSACRRVLVQYNQGCAYLRLGAREDIVRAVGCLSEASERSGSCGRPDIAALAQRQLEKILPAVNKPARQTR